MYLKLLTAALLTVSPQAFAGNPLVVDYNEDTRAERNARIQASIAPGIMNAPIPKNERWERFAFDGRPAKFGDVAIEPFGAGADYKINAINYNIRPGENIKVPFQVFLADLSSTEEPEKTNEEEIQDPTQGLAIRFPVLWQYHGRKDGGLCNFKQLAGFCSLGGDVTIRSVKLNEGSAGGTQETSIFGTSAGISLGLLFPVFNSDDTEAGKLGLSAGMRYYDHDTDNHDLLFRDLVDPNGTPIQFDGTFRSFTIESQLEIKERFSVRLEYFKPLDNKDALDSVTKVSFVVSTPK